MGEKAKQEKEFAMKQEALKRMEEEGKRELEAKQREKEEKERKREMIQKENARLEEESRLKQEALQKMEQESNRVAREQVMHKKQLQKQNLKSIDDKEQIKENWKLERKETSLFVDQKSNQKVQAKEPLRAVSASPQVSRRTGQGFGQVKTGHVMSTKISFFKRTASEERELTATPEPRKRLGRFQGIDSPRQSPFQKPLIKTGDVTANIRGWTQKVQDHEAQMSRKSPVSLGPARQCETPSPPLPPPPSMADLHAKDVVEIFDYTDL